MPTPTGHLALLKPSTADPFVTADLASNLQKIDDHPGIRVVTSTTRPAWAAAQAGMFISETDTGNMMRWTGTDWVPAGRFTAKVAADVPLMVKGATGQTGDLLQFQNSAGTVIARVAPNGDMYVGAAKLGETTFAGSGAATTAAHSDHNHSGVYQPAGSYAAASHSHDVSGASVNFANSSNFANTAGSAPANGGTASAVSQAGFYFGPGGCTNASLADGETWLRIDGVGNFFTSGPPSLRSFKKSIKKANVDTDALLGLEPKRYFFNDKAHEVDQEDGEQVGLIAEEVQDAGIDLLLHRNQKTNEVSSLRYDKIGVLLLPIVKDLRERIVTLESAK